MAMVDNACMYPGDRDDALVGYLYDDIDAATRASFAAHLASCERCRAELDELGGVRAQLGTWAPPEPMRAFAHAAPVQYKRSNAWTVLREIPAWAQVAAALLVLGVAAGIANLDVRYNQDGLTVRTGWSRPAAAPTIATGGDTPAVTTTAVQRGPRSMSNSTNDAPWRADLTALERQLRSEFHAADVASAPRRASLAPANDVELIRRVRALIQESERKLQREQQRELALRVAEVIQDVNGQRAADLVRIEQSLGLLQKNTGMELVKQRQQLSYLVRTSSQK